MRLSPTPHLLVWVGATWLSCWLGVGVGHNIPGSSPSPGYPGSSNSNGFTLGHVAFAFTQPSYSGSIYERSEVKTYIKTGQKMGIHLQYPNNAEVEYSIVEGDPEAIFTAEALTVKDFSFLRIRTQTGNYWKLNREHEGMFRLRIKGRASYPGDLTLENYTQVVVTVLDVNEFSPMFPTALYEVSIPEDTALYRSIGQVSAYDADAGLNGEIYYSLAQPSPVFSVHQTTGVVSLTRPIRYSQAAVYELDIEAQDRGLATQRPDASPNSRTKFRVNVSPVNTHAPTIVIHNHQSLIEHGNVGSVFAVLSITDEDRGEHGEIGGVTITNDPRRVFSLVPDSAKGMYNVMVMSSIDRETSPDHFNITVAAVDRGTPAKTSMVVIPVRVQDINDNEPQFEHSVYTVELSEVVPVNTPVVFVQAHDKDLGSNAEVLYSIVDGNRRGLFAIDPESGLIRTTGILDAETELRVMLVVQAQDQANSGSRKTGQARVNVLIKDYNDNAPAFNLEKNYVSVKENLPRRSVVTTVYAHDEDSGDNGKLSYNLVNYDDVPFQIDSFTGEVTTSEVLDFETMRRNYDLHIRVSDWGTPFRREESTVLSVRLEDVNDNSPEFEKVRCSGHLSQDLPLKTSVVTLSAIDFDSGNVITYSIIEGNDDHCFSLDPSTGVLLTNCDLSDFHKDDSRVLTVVASDGQHVSIPTTVNLTLAGSGRSAVLDRVHVTCQKTDVAARLQQQVQKSKSSRLSEHVIVIDRLSKGHNNNSPLVSNACPVLLEVSESTKVGVVILDFGSYVTDADSGYNGELTFVISAGDDLHGKFKLDSFSGKLQVLSNLDFEDKAEFNLTLTALDLGQPSRYVSKDVRVKLIDENDNAPRFERTQYAKLISENASVDSVVLQVTSSDLDTGLNGQVRYSIVSNNRDFYIDPEQGILKVKRPLDREEQPSQILLIRAEDSGLHSKLSSTATVTVTITDVNDNSPVFVQDVSLVRVPEDTPVGAVILTVTATDADSDDNGLVSYTLSSSAASGHFEVDSQTGSIRIKQSLDYEVRQVHNITIVAVDGGRPALSSSCLVIVEVMDVNENLFAPDFYDFWANGSVAENLPVGSYVMHVQAEDGDDPRHGVGQVFYVIQDGSGLGRFSIDVNGTIRTSQVLDRETTGHYWLTVVAQDRALVPQFARLEVLVTVLDVNEKIPLSLEPVYYVSVEENSPVVQPLLQILATDGDGDGLQPLVFSITGGNPQNLFSIDSRTGVISTTGRGLDREKQEEHAIEVTISDQDQPPLSSNTRVVIKVLDQNDNRPEFIQDRRMQVTAFSTPHSGREDIFIYQTVAHDSDQGPNGQVSYELKSGARDTQFRVDADTGDIYSTRDLLEGEYELTIRASDNGVPPRRSQMRLEIEVVPRSTRVRPKPRFSQDVYEESISESDRPGQLILLLSVLEDDHSRKLRYSIEGGNSDHKFTIQPDHGSIFLAQPLDWETRSEYNLTVAVTDGLVSQLATVLINVVDVNDNEPIFSQKLYRANVSENTGVGSPVLTLSATDLDRNKNLLFTIESAASTRSLEKFSIGAVSGEIVVSGSLDREVLSRHLFTVMVRDQGIPSRRAYARLEILVLDHNDHAPRFLYENIKSQVYETAALGTSVTQVMAVDEDKGHNAELIYEIMAGNADSTFTIDRQLGIISVAKELDRRIRPYFEMIVSATDKGHPSLSGTSTVQVAVTMSTNSPPKFSSDQYMAEILENSPANTVLMSVSAECLSSVTYVITGNDDDNYFNINPLSGVISTTKPIDFERIRFFNLSVSATNVVSASKTANVIIHVVDVNDNEPFFWNILHTGNISESAVPGTIVFNTSRLPLVIAASDFDSGHNARLAYHIVEPSARQYFSIDPLTGVIRTTASLDYEAKKVYNFSVQVTDQGSPQYQALEAANVLIYVSDVNDNPPKFTHELYKAQLVLPTFPGVSVLQVKAVDPDTQSGKSLSYSIVSGNEEEGFTLNETDGSILVAKDSMLREQYNLTVQATDGKFISKSRLTITVQQPGGHGLKFTRDRYTASIQENNADVLQLVVIQPVGMGDDSYVTFTLLNHQDYFSVGVTSGVLSTIGRVFDREKKNNFTVVIKVEEAGAGKQRAGNVFVFVTVLDENDNPPMFLNLPYHCTVSGSAKEGQVIQVVRASDPDSGENAELKYRLVDTYSDKFAFNPYTRELLVKKLDSYDHNTEVELMVVVQDRGLPSLSATATIYVHIADSSSPLFEQLVYNASVAENMSPHSPVIAVKAISPHGQKLIYSITKGDKHGEFAIDFNTGYVSAADVLDYETTKSYQLVVRASDVFTGSYAEAIINVNVEDANDNAPIFAASSYFHSMSEVSSVGSHVLTVSASDADSGANALIHYSLSSLDPARRDVEHFSINTQTGEISLRKDLDYEKQQEYHFLVVAQDSGLPVFSSTAQFILKVEDINDNPPYFILLPYNCFISDSARPGQLVFKITALDPDLSDTQKLRYSIVDGNEKDTFSLDSLSGVISLSRQRRPVLTTSEMLNVSVSDSVYTSFARVSVDIHNTNRHSPAFGKEVYRVGVAENQGFGSRVVTVTAVDGDRGNYGMMAYTIVDDKMAHIFAIDADTGEITLKTSLDRESRSQYRLTVAATDNGGRMGFARVELEVLDLNDNVPQFLMSEYRANVAGNAAAGSGVIRIQAYDQDESLNAKIKYSIHPGQDPLVETLFTIDPETGWITTKGILTTSENQVFQMFVAARDLGSPSNENLVPVEILVMGSGDVAPRFVDSSRFFLVSEHEQEGNVIATVKARSGTPVKYSMVKGFINGTDQSPILSVDDFGQLRLVRPLDREIVSFYTLFVRAETRTSPSLVDHMEISIEVQDVSDNTPIFSSSHYTATIPENTPLGHSIIQLQAHDLDLEVRPLRFSFSPGMAELASLFLVDAETGWIVLLAELDREKRDMYNLSIVVSDSPVGITRKSAGIMALTATTSVIIMVTDYNDNPPKFERDSYIAAVNEGALSNTILVRLVTKDGDTEPNALVTYYIIEGDLLAQFRINSQGELLVNKALDRETTDRYSITVAATDGSFVSYSSIIVDILDDNDNIPVCNQPFQTSDVNEDVPVGTSVAHIHATDADEAGTINAKIDYSLQGEGSEYFAIDKDSGIIRTARPLDRETQPRHLLIAVARDGGGLSCTASVLVILKDINDNPPILGSGNLRESYSIREDAPVHTLLTRVVALDADIGINSQINYQLSANSSGVFSIDSETGIISLVALLDRERYPSYNLTIIAYNPIAPELSSEATVTVLVLDVNDNPPEFEHSMYKTSLPESALVGTKVAQVKATSLDIGINADITYSLVAGNEQGKFAIDPLTGTLTVAEPLDHELSREYFLTVLATDQGTPPLSNTAVVSINISDINDNPPRFSQDTYSLRVNENVAAGTEIFKVLATDSDSPPNAVITYSLMDGNVHNHFIIDPRDGILQIRSPLDREETASFSLVVQAHDSGQPMLLSTAVINLIVEDANDNPPLFSQNVYKGLVQEGRRTGIEIVTVTVSDADLPENGAPFVYEIISGNENGEFHIDGLGVISTAGRLTKKVKEKYMLTVRAYDGGKPPLYSEAVVEVEVLDESLYPPEVHDLSISIRSCVSSFPGGVIGRVKASDRDPFDKTIYGIVSANSHLFDIHRYDGRLIALTVLDAGEYLVNVSVSDGKFTSYGKVDIAVTCTSKEKLENSLTIQFENMVEEQFYANFKIDFQRVLKQELEVRMSDIEIINVQPASESLVEKNKNVVRKKHRSRRDTSDNLDVLFVVHKPPDKFYNKRALKRKVEKIRGRMESVLGTKIVEIFFDTCDESSCKFGTCVGKVQFDESTLVPVLVNGASFVSARHRYIEKCTCLEGNCSKQACGETTCAANQVCHKDAFGDFLCRCPEGHSGDMCESVVPLCSGSTCPVERPMTFSGKSYARWKLQYSTKKRFSLTLRIRTRQKSAILLYAKGKLDYSILKMERGSLIYIFDCGSGEGFVRIPVDLSDGQWHMIELTRHGREAELSLDSSYTAVGVAPGIQAILNIESEEIYLGAEVDVFPNGYRVVSHGFEGCMEDIRVFNIALPFSGSNELAQAIEFELVEFHCQDFPAKFLPTGNACSSNPCLNGGQCRASGAGSYSCQCSSRYKGPKCELDSDPCRSQPCHNEGICEVDSDAPNSVICLCRNRMLGLKCSYGKFCQPNPCKAGGTCIEGPNAALCDCAFGYQGLYCDKQSDACVSSPCLHGSTCHNTPGGTYSCNCTEEHTGKNCEILALIAGGVKSTPASLLYGLIGTFACVILVVALVIACLVWRRKKQSQQRRALQLGLPESGSENLLYSLKEKRCKLSNPDLSVPVEIIPCQPPPQPPPVPTRPASYTPSTHDSLSVLNNLDSVGNYGSAAEDLENTGLRGRIPDFYEYMDSYQYAKDPSHVHLMLRATPPPLGSRTVSETESIQKATWEFEYPNILNYMEVEGDKKQNEKLAKQMPGVHSPNPSPAIGYRRSPMGGDQQVPEVMLPNSSRVLSPGVSGWVRPPEIASVSSFDGSEDDLNGYHWDTSDWAPGPSMPNISEIPTNEVLHSPSSSQPSDDCNANADNFDDDNITTRAIYNGDDNFPLLSSSEQRRNNFDTGNAEEDDNDDDEENLISSLFGSQQGQDYFEDSEYVGDSEYAENEPYDPEYLPSYAHRPNYENLLPDFCDTGYQLPGNLSVHPNKYLPGFELSQQDLVMDPLTEDENGDSRSQTTMFASSESMKKQDCPSLRPPKEFMTPVSITDRYTTHEDPSSRLLFLDDMSMSMGGLASTASFSDIPGLCEIVDSEMDITDTDDENTPCLTHGQLQTQV